jgi:RNA polymerase sigma-70 factor (ECF subfamily)
LYLSTETGVFTGRMNPPVELALRLEPRAVAPSDRASAGEERAVFARLVREHGRALFALASRLAARPSDAEDLYQDALLRAWRGLPGFRGDGSARTWLFRILVNAWRSARPRLVPASLDREPAGAESADPLRATSRRDLVARVLAAVDELPRRQRETLLLRARGGLGYDEIAAVMGIRRGAVKSHLVLARRKLLARFGAEIGDLGRVR